MPIYPKVPGIPGTAPTLPPRLKPMGPVPRVPGTPFTKPDRGPASWTPGTPFTKPDRGPAPWVPGTPRPGAKPSPALEPKGQYHQGFPGGQGGGGPGGGGYGHPGGRPGGPDPAWLAAMEAWRGQRPEFDRTQMDAWLGTRPEGRDPAAIAAWQAQNPRMDWREDVNAWQGLRPDRQDFMTPGPPQNAPRLGGSQRGGFPFGGFRREGGHIRGGRAYVVGEEGPEVVVPDTGGTVVPVRGQGSYSRRFNFGGPRPRPSQDGGGTQTPTPTPTPTPTTPGTWENAEHGVNEYGGKGRIPGESIQDYFRRNMLAVLRGHAAQGDFGTPTPRPGTTPPPTTPPPGGSGAIPLPPATGGTGVGGGAMSPGMAFTLNNMIPMRGFQFPQYTQTWAMNPDVFGRTY